MTKQERQDFEVHCLDEIRRFTAFGDFSLRTRAEGVAEAARWLARVCAGDDKEAREAKAAALVDATIAECLEAGIAPDLLILARVKDVLFPPEPPPPPPVDCEFCSGSGYEVVVTARGQTGVRPCRLGHAAQEREKPADNGTRTSVFEQPIDVLALIDGLTGKQ